MSHVVRRDPLGFPRLYEVTPWGTTRAASPPCLTREAALSHIPQTRTRK